MAKANFFFGYLVAISFRNRIDFWGRLCRHPFKVFSEKS